MGSRNIGEIDATELGEVIDYQERVKEDPPTHTHTHAPGFWFEQASRWWGHFLRMRKYVLGWGWRTAKMTASVESTGLRCPRRHPSEHAVPAVSKQIWSSEGSLPEEATRDTKA